MKYEVKTLRSGCIETLTLEAADEASARFQVASQGRQVLSLRSQGAHRLRAWRSPRFPLLTFSQELAALLHAGLTLTEAIEALAENERPGEVQVILARLMQGLREGRPFSATLAGLSGEFSSLFVATITASEKTGDLATALDRYVAYQERIDQLRRKIINAAIYPAILVATGGLVVLFLLGYVLPRLAAALGDMADGMPASSRLLFATGRWIGEHPGLILLLLGGAGIGGASLIRNGRLRPVLMSLVSRIPYMAGQFRVFHLARLYRTLGMLLRAGIPAVTALGMVEGLLPPPLRRQLGEATRAVREGHPLSRSLEKQGLTTPVAARMLRVGENAGNMSDMTQRIADFYDNDVARWLDRTTRLVEPLLMAFIGLLIGGIVMLMYMPIFELAGSLQ